MRERHSLLKRQIKRHFGETPPDSEAWRHFLNAINDAYREFEDDHKMLERSLDLSSRELMQANSAMRAVITAFPDLFLWVDTNGRVVDCKGGGNAAFFITETEIIGKHIRNFHLPEIGQKFEKAVHHAFQNSIISNLEYEYAVEDISQHFEARILPLSSPQCLCIVRNITEKKRLETLFRQSQKMESIGTLAGGIAHDFNNILSAIMGYTEMSLGDVAPDSKVGHRLNRVLQASERAKDLVNQILTFSRQKEQARRPLHIKPITKEALKLLRASIPSTIRFEIDIREDSGVILADPTQIHQLLMNLCTNASHAMETGGGVLTIKIRNLKIDDADLPSHPDLQKGEYVNLRIADTGHGMSPQILEKIFDPYFTTKKHGEGTGLGLSLVHGIVRSMDGAIEVFSKPGMGTTFDIFFPRFASDMIETLKQEPPAPTGDETILLVDDEDFVLDMTREMLESIGYTVISRISSVEALNAFRDHPHYFDLVITDQTMPNMTGQELAAKILEARPGMPIILCTGFSALNTQEKALQSGIAALLHKPILKNGLATVVREVLDRAVQS